jgi:hypothetical protein
MQSLHVALEADTDQKLESGVETACVAGSAVVVVASAGDGYCRCDVGAFVHAAFQGSVDTVAGVGKMIVPDGSDVRCAQKTHCAVAQSQEVGRACCHAVRVGPSLGVIVGTGAEAAGNP